MASLAKAIDNFLKSHPPSTPYTEEELLSHMAELGFLDTQTIRRLYFGFPFERRYLISNAVSP